MSAKNLMRDPRAERQFREIYDAYHRHVYAYFKRRTDTASAQDGAAETFLVAWKRFDDVPSGNRTLPWLYGVAFKVLSNQRRSARRLGRLMQKVAGMASDPGPSPEAVVVRRSEDQEVLGAIGRLRPADREVLRLTTWEELSHAEIAGVLGCSAHAVDQRLYRETRRLARELRTSGYKSITETIPDQAPPGEAS